MHELIMEIKSILGEEKKVLSKLEELFQPLSFCQEDCWDVKCAVAEGCLNAIEHGNQLCADFNVRVQIRIQGNLVKVVISDCGMRSESTPCPVISPERGWGILFISKLMDNYRFCFLEEQTMLYMEKTMSKEAGGTT
ncbi:ATP-binding protein [Ammoniphilus sp. 3BR4]|uniref:ATP-binding protein n=1 Tax=Ammoniphilus sp. 3BR4 TaxID=3158265 RepID=UPI00346548B9